MSDDRFLIFIRFAAAPAGQEEAWNRWYDETHIPVRLAMPGFAAARRFEADTGDIKHLSLYELEPLDAITSDIYLENRRREASLPEDSFEAQTLKLPGFERGIYRQVFPDTPYRMPDTEELFVIGHDIPPGKEDEFYAWYHTEHIPAMLLCPGFITARHFKMADTLPASSGQQSTSPQYITIYDLSDKQALHSEQFLRDQNSPWSSWIRSWYTKRLRVQARRVFAGAAPTKD